MTKKITHSRGCIASVLNRKMKLLVVAAALVTGGLQAQTTVTINYGDLGQTNGAGIWTCPANVTSMKIECWGGGGAGGAALALPTTANASYRGNVMGGGGAGGSYAAVIISNPTAGDYSYAIGVGAIPVAQGSDPDYFTNLAVSNGANTTFSNTASAVIVQAVGGAGGQSAKNNIADGVFGLGGVKVASGNIGTTSFYGGSGGDAANIASTTVSGGAGGSAGATSNGGDALNNTGGIAGTDGGVAGSNGFSGNSGNNLGVAGLAPGAGGNGAMVRATLSTSFVYRAGGKGGNGLIKITYTGATTGLSTVKANGFVTVAGKNLLLNGDVNAVEVFNAQGKLIQSQNKVTSVSVNKNGIYIVKLHTPQGVTVQKVIVK